MVLLAGARVACPFKRCDQMTFGGTHHLRRMTSMFKKVFKKKDELNLTKRSQMDQVDRDP